MLETRGLVKRYGSGDATVAALRGVDLRIGAGEFVAIMGPSGSGKSTLVHLMGALDTPSEGEVLIEGRALSTLDDDERTELRRERIGFVFQAFNLVPVLSAAENVGLPLVIAGAPAAEVRQRVEELLDTVGLRDRADVLASQLSGGEQQRVAVARAVVHQPSVVFADEPTGSLDQAAGRQVMGLLRRLHDRGQTIVLVTHEPRVASYADRIVLMQDGEVVDEINVPTPGDPAGVIARLVDHDQTGVSP